MTDKYSIGKRPSWVEHISDKELIALSFDDAKDVEIKASGKGLCYINSEIINTSNTTTEKYCLRVWNLSNVQLLQSASVHEILLSNDQHLVIHRVSLIRDGKIIEKTNSLNIRVMDDERDSNFGTISKTKKINWTIDDVHLQDVLILEYTIVQIFGSDAELDKKYFRHIQLMPSTYWFYKKYFFKLINNRGEDVRTIQRYFRDEKGQKIASDSILIRKGDNLIFEKNGFQTLHQNDVFLPYIEIATNATWHEISNNIYSLYKEGLNDTTLVESPAYNTLVFEVNLDESVRKMIEYVQNQIVYIFDAEVMHGYIPQSANVTLLQKSGDCKAKSLLLVSLLKTLHVEAEMILVNYGVDFFMNENLPSPFIFNHVIVKITYKGKDYFVDPTWSNRYGLLEKRTEPSFSTYLPIVENAELIKTREKVPSNFNIEQDVHITLDNQENLIHIETVFRQASADIIRNQFITDDKAKIINNQNDLLTNRLFSDGSRKAHDLIKDAEYTIVSDDQNENLLRVQYDAKLIDPYIKVNNGRVFKYYNFLPSTNLTSFNHKDLPAHSFVAFPLKYTLHISSRDFVSRKDKVTTRNTEIDNNYFQFSNKKKISFCSVFVESQYKPKIYCNVKPEDFESLKKDYVKINQSNFGIGIVFANFWQYIFKNSYMLVVLFIIIRIIIAVATQ